VVGGGVGGGGWGLGKEETQELQRREKAEKQAEQRAHERVKWSGGWSASRDAVASTAHCSSTHTTTHYNTLQHTATHCNALQHTATHGITVSTPQVSSTHMPPVHGVQGQEDHVSVQGGGVGGGRGVIEGSLDTMLTILEEAARIRKGADVLEDSKLNLDVMLQVLQQQSG